MATRYKVIYNRRGKWYPGERVVSTTFMTRAQAMTYLKNLQRRTNYKDREIMKAEVVAFQSKPRRKSSRLRF